MVNIVQALKKLINTTEKKTLLWTNPSPTSSFVGQALSLDLSGYDALEILFNFSTSTSYGVENIVKINTGEKAYVNGIFSAKLCRRTVNTDSSGVTISDGHHFNSYGSTATTLNNDVLIPIRIYGIKFAGGVISLIEALCRKAVRAW